MPRRMPHCMPCCIPVTGHGQVVVGHGSDDSAYLVAEHAQVVTKHNNDEQYIKESTASGTFMIMRNTVNPPQGCSSETHLYLKEGQLKYLKKVCSFQINSEYILTCTFNFVGSSG